MQERGNAMDDERNLEKLQRAAQELFGRYERVFNDGLAGKVDLADIAALYADAFVGASPAGVVAGRNDDQLLKVSQEGFRHYRATGAQRMEVRHVQVTAIDAFHGLARVDWRATYEVQGMRKPIDFTNTYLVRAKDDEARVFGWITGDEAALLREHGIG